VRELKGMFGKAARSVSIEEMNRSIADRGAAAGLRFKGRAATRVGRTK
jgi:hypothetical protein